MCRFSVLPSRDILLISKGIRVSTRRARQFLVFIQFRNFVKFLIIAFCFKFFITLFFSRFLLILYKIVVYILRTYADKSNSFFSVDQFIYQHLYHKNSQLQTNNLFHKSLLLQYLTSTMKKKHTPLTKPVLMDEFY